jgi:hypothetical protein
VEQLTWKNHGTGLRALNVEVSESAICIHSSCSGVRMARIAIIVGHARHNTFCEALGRAYRRGAQATGHEATLFVTSAMAFNPVLHEGFERVQPLEKDLQVAHDAMLAADHLVIIFSALARYICGHSQRFS